MRKRLSELSRLPTLPGVHLRDEASKIKRRLHELGGGGRGDSSAAWEKVKLARHADRPYTLDYIGLMFPGFIELRGDRCFANDPAIVGGLAAYQGRTLMVIGHQKGRDLASRTQRNFGMPRPEGYRKAQRLMALADKFGIPILTLIDTPGAFPGIAAEERGQGGAIASTLMRMTRLRVPTVAIIIGEGGSGGALALALADRVLMLENSVYSVITPEACAAILWRDAKEARPAARALKMTSADLEELEVIDGVLPEPRGGAHRDHEGAARIVKEALEENLRELEMIHPQARRQERLEKFRRIGVWRENGLTLF
ncbi:acetyl-coenzyme A carboxylase carboxyl transferase subunit alpha [bacterium BMS3Abin01]|nr:acetyl-coenzyme A carboxylase carboxyl transferase subunit alpha [bacterium BMS3Abin01]HDY69395.1 acetyl-CoA carboxylase carboxyltransferase subunit alpha [Actinomycetota bacterium]